MLLKFEVGGVGGLYLRRKWTSTLLPFYPQALIERGRALPGSRLPGIESTNISVRVRLQNEKSVGFQILPVEIKLFKKKELKKIKRIYPGRNQDCDLCR